VKRFCDPRLWEFLDGRPGRLSRFRLAVREIIDSDVAADAAVHRRQNRGLQSIGASALAEPVPQRMHDLLAAAVDEPEPPLEPRALWHAGYFWLAAALAVSAGSILWWAR
jgi:hypothetical protein